MADSDMTKSRNEKILRATIDGTEYSAEPQSRIESLLLELKDSLTPIVKLTQAEYDALENPDENTLYVIVEEA